MVIEGCPFSHACLVSWPFWGRFFGGFTCVLGWFGGALGMLLCAVGGTLGVKWKETPLCEYISQSTYVHIPQKRDVHTG